VTRDCGKRHEKEEQRARFWNRVSRPKVVDGEDSSVVAAPLDPANHRIGADTEEDRRLPNVR
jgi:hypothetical protein